MIIVNQCDRCVYNCRPIISENGLHYVCSLGPLASKNCVMGKVTHFKDVLAIKREEKK